jgi:Tfp pilus assembly protein PilN
VPGGEVRMSRPLNLASRPVRNDRLPGLLFVVATGVLALVTVYHVLVVRRFWPSRSAALRHEIEMLQVEMKNLEAQATRLRAQPVSAPQVAEWKILRELVDRRTFWWSELFASFEKSLPAHVRIMSVSPHVKDGHYLIDLEARLTSPQDGLDFAKVLEDRPEFEKVYPRDCGEQQGQYECRYEMTYLGQTAEPKGAVASGGNR